MAVKNKNKNIMKKLTFTKVYSKMNQDFYKSSEPLTKGLLRLIDTNYEYNAKNERKRLKKEVHECVKEEGFYIVCISTAITHAEKLAFAAAQKDNGECFRLEGQIEGVHTMSIDGGDPFMCWEDEKYLRLIARHNGYSQNQVEIL